jgi:LuxR family maltose regulon positive regulatory protein
VTRWLEGLPEGAIMATPPVAFVAAWIGGFSGASKQQTQRRLAVVEDGSWEGPLPEGISSLGFGAALTRAALVYGDVGRAVGAARRALELAGPEPSPFSWMAQAALGQALYLSGQPTQARPQLEELVRRVSAAEQPYAVVTALAVLSLIAGDEGRDRTAGARAGHAAVLAEAHGLSGEPLCGIVHMAVGRALTLHGKLAEAEEQLGRALELLGIDSMLVQRAHALLLLASVRQVHGNLPGARALVEQARELVERLADPGSLPVLVEQANRNLGSASRPQVAAATPLTTRERAVLRLLPTPLSNREIGRELYVSINTVRSQVRAIYRKLEVTSRAEAVAHARHLRLLPGSTPTDR